MSRHGGNSTCIHGCVGLFVCIPVCMFFFLCVCLCVCVYVCVCLCSNILIYNSNLLEQRCSGVSGRVILTQEELRPFHVK